MLHCGWRNGVYTRRAPAVAKVTLSANKFEFGERNMIVHEFKHIVRAAMAQIPAPSPRRTLRFRWDGNAGARKSMISLRRLSNSLQYNWREFAIHCLWIVMRYASKVFCIIVSEQDKIMLQAARQPLFQKYSSFLEKSILTLVIFCCASAHAGLEDRKFEDVRLSLIGEIQSMLITGGICGGVANCQKMQLIFASPLSGGIAVQVWGIDNPEILKQITIICASAFTTNAEVEIISIDFFRMSKQSAVDLPIWKSVKPNHEITFRRKKHADR